MWKIINWRKNTPAGDYAEAQKEIEIRYPGIPEKTYQMERRRKKKRIGEHIDSFISDSTLHGLHFCFDKKHLIRRIVWTLILLSAFGYVTEKLYASVNEFFRYPMRTTTTVVYKNNMELPAISICNRNDFRQSQLKGTKLEKALDRVIPFSALNGSEYRDTVDRSNHRLQDMFIKGEAISIPFGPENFTSYWDNSGTTKCYTFNSDVKSILTVNKTGDKGAVTMVLNVEQYEYDPNTVDAGMRLILHGQDQTPIKTAGILLSPGFQTYVEVKKRKIKNLPKPYRTECGETKLKHFDAYSQHSCWLDKLTNKVFEECGCIDAFMPGKYPVCSLEMMSNCTWNTWVAFDNRMDYDCPIPCEMYEFSAKLSQSRYPSNKVADKFAADNSLTGSPMENRLYIRENYLRVVIFYGDLNYELVEQLPSYDLKILLGDIGGQLGLFLGSSVLTYMEFFDCFFMLLYAKYFETFLPK